MLSISCNHSPLIFKPIALLLEALDFKADCLQDYLVLNLVDPLNPKYKRYRKDSHLTDAQTEQEQIRYLGNVEIERKLMYLAQRLKELGLVANKRICFEVSPYFKTSEMFQIFVQFMSLYSDCQIDFTFTKKENTTLYTSERSQEIELLHFSSEQTKQESAQILYNAAKTCINSGDYWSAINLLLGIRDLENESLLDIEIFCNLGTTYQAIGDSIKADFYWQRALEKGNLNQRNRSYYALAMMNLRHHPKKFQNTERGGDLLQNAYEELSAESTPENIDLEVDKVFNRNGYALYVFKKKNLEEAQNLVQTGINYLDTIDSDYSRFHQSVLYYNLFQCYATKNELEAAEATLRKLISIDPKFFAYYEYLAEFLIRTQQYEKALEVIHDGIEVEPDYAKFYNLIGSIKHLNNNTTEAIQAFEKAIQLNPIDTSSLAYLSSFYNTLGHFEASRKLLKDFNFKFNNNENGETVLCNQIIALLNTEGEEDILELVKQAHILRPHSLIIKDIHDKITLAYVS